MCLNSCKNVTENRLVFIENNFIKVGVLPDVGGRIVFLSNGDNNNILYSNEEFWNEPRQNRIIPKAESDFKAYDGFITWIGPQSDWWSQQDINEIKRSEKHNWPPDPYIIYGCYKIVKRTDTVLIMEGEDSPISGLKFYKKFSLHNNQLKIEVKARNIRQQEVKWDLWSNIRFPGFTSFLIPANIDQIKSFDAEVNETTDSMRYNFYNNFFSFMPEEPSKGKNMRSSKAFLNPDKGIMAAFRNNNMLLISFDKVREENLYPNQAFVEVYNRIATDTSLNLLELEHHSAYKTIQPGEYIILNEVWQLLNCNETSTKRQQIDCFNKALGIINN